MFLFRATILVMSVIILSVSCTKKIESSVVDYEKDPNAQLPYWECHQLYLKSVDSVSGGSFLEVIAYHENAYPGFSLGWLNGNWRPYKSLTITARMRGKSPARFSLSIWDGKGTYKYENRFQKTFWIDTCWTNCTINIPNGLPKPNGSHIDLRTITRTVFFTLKSANVLVFNVKCIRLE